MKQRIFIGGVHGVGKTTVVEKLRQQNPSWAIYDPGALFWDYGIKQQLVTTSAIEKMAAESLKGLRPDTTLINWHYAVWTPNGYIPQIDLELWKDVVQSWKNDRIVLIWLYANPLTILDRRKKDAEIGLKKRKVDIACIGEENEKTEYFFNRHLQVLRESHPNWTARIISNGNIEETAAKILKAVRD